MLGVAEGFEAQGMQEQVAEMWLWNLQSSRWWHTWGWSSSCTLALPQPGGDIDQQTWVANLDACCHC